MKRPAFAAAIVLVLLLGAGVYAWKTGLLVSRRETEGPRSGPGAVRKVNDPPSTNASVRPGETITPVPLLSGVGGNKPVAKKEYLEAPKLAADAIVKLILESEADPGSGEFTALDQQGPQTILKFDRPQLEGFLEHIRAAADEMGEHKRGNLIIHILIPVSMLDPEVALGVCLEYKELLLARQRATPVDTPAVASGLAGFFLAAVARNDPERAIRWMDAHAADFEDAPPEHFERGILYAVAERDPGEAFEFIGRMEMKETAKAVETIMQASEFSEQAKSALVAYGAYRDGLRDQAARVALAPGLSGLDRLISQIGMESGVELIEAIELGPAEMNVIVANLKPFPLMDEPGKWIGWLEEKVPLEVSGPAIERILSDWASNVPKEASDWAEKLPAGGRQNDFLVRIQRAWPEDEAEGAAAFAAKHGMKPLERENVE